MDEIVPGVHHWRARHPEMGQEVDSYWLPESGAVIDPMLPEGAGPEFVPGEVRHVILTIGLHTRSGPAFGLPLRVAREGLHRFEGRDLELEPFDDGDELAPGLRALKLGAIAPDDYVLHVAAGPGALAFADGLIGYGGVGFVPDDLLGDEADEVKRDTHRALGPLLELDFDALLFAHGTPIAPGGKAALRAFADTAAA